jgi:hypothetical protein
MLPLASPRERMQRPSTEVPPSLPQAVSWVLALSLPVLLVLIRLGAAEIAIRSSLRGLGLLSDICLHTSDSWTRIEELPGNQFTREPLDPEVAKKSGLEALRHGAHLSSERPD